MPPASGRAHSQQKGRMGRTELYDPESESSRAELPGQFDLAKGKRFLAHWSEMRQKLEQLQEELTKEGIWEEQLDALALSIRGGKLVKPELGAFCQEAITLLMESPSY